MSASIQSSYGISTSSRPTRRTPTPSSWRGRRVQAVHGPYDLRFPDVAQILIETTGHHVEARRISDEELSSALIDVGLPAQAVDGLVGIARGMQSGFRPENPRTALTTTPTTLAEWVVARRDDLGFEPS